MTQGGDWPLTFTCLFGACLSQMSLNTLVQARYMSSGSFNTECTDHGASSTSRVKSNRFNLLKVRPLTIFFFWGGGGFLIFVLKQPYMDLYELVVRNAQLQCTSVRYHLLSAGLTYSLKCKFFDQYLRPFYFG